MKRLYISAILSVLVLTAIIIAGCAGVQRQIDVEPYIKRALAYHEKGQYDEAIADYSKAIEINPRYAGIYNNRGIAYRKKGQYDEAIADYSKAIEINPRYAEAYNNRGVAYHNKRQYDKAIADYSKAIEINPRYAGAYRNRGIAYHNKRQYDKAIADYSKAIEINPRYYKAYCNKATTCERAGYIREAIEAYIGLIMYAPSKDSGQIKHARERIKELDLKLSQKLKLASHRSSENIRYSDRTRILGE